MSGYDPARRSPWTPFLVRLAVALIVLTPFVAILIQALVSADGCPTGPRRLPLARLLF